MEDKDLDYVVSVRFNKTQQMFLRELAIMSDPPETESEVLRYIVNELMHQNIRDLKRKVSLYEQFWHWFLGLKT